MDIKFLGSLTGQLQGTLNDIVFTTDNDLDVVEENAYVKQKVTKVLLSTLGRDPYFDGYGTELPFLLHEDIGDPAIQSAVTNAIIGSISYLQEQEESTLPKDQIKTITDLQLQAYPESNEIDTTLFLVLGDDTDLEVTVPLPV